MRKAIPLCKNARENLRDTCTDNGSIVKLYAEVTSERASKGQGGNEYLIIDLNVNRVPIGQVEIVYNADTELDKTITEDEWVLQYHSQDEQDDWEIIAQGNIKPDTRGKKQ